jgi:hypothetical protein
MIPHFRTHQITLQGETRSTVVGTVTSLQANDPEFDTSYTQQLCLILQNGEIGSGDTQPPNQLVNTSPSQKSVPPPL